MTPSQVNDSNVSGTKADSAHAGGAACKERGGSGEGAHRVWCSVDWAATKGRHNQRLDDENLAGGMGHLQTPGKTCCTKNATKDDWAENGGNRT